MGIGLLCAHGTALAQRRPAIASLPAPSELVQFDPGAKKGARNFQAIGHCVDKPCVITQHGAWRFDPAVVGTQRVTMGYIHDGTLRSILLFQESTTLEQMLGERVLNRYPNRKVINLMRMVETGTTQTIYMYGLLLQHDIAEGDPIVITLTDPANSTGTHDFYFRYHRTGVVPDIDLALLYPLDYFRPNPNGAIQGATAGIAFSFSVGSNMDPERQYGWARKILRAVRFNLFTGLLSRKELTPIGGDLVVRDRFDGFGGAGITLFDFLNAGYGINFVRSPHSFFPFVGVEVRHVFEFIRSLKPDTHSRWKRYLEEETAR